MSATTAGAVKAVVEGAGLGLACYRDAAPTGAVLPYVTVTEGVAYVNDADGAYDDDVDHTVQETISVDLWQRWRAIDGLPGESYTLAAALRMVLRSTRLPTAPTHVHGCQMVGAVRLLEDDTNVVHDALTLRVRRVQG